MKKLNIKKIVALVCVGIVAGGINGLFGAGSGLVLVPMIQLICKMENKEAHATTLATVLAMCVATAGVYIFNKQVDYQVFLWCLIGSVIGGVVGTVLLKKLKNEVIGLMFSCVLVVAGIVMIIL